MSHDKVEKGDFMSFLSHLNYVKVLIMNGLSIISPLCIYLMYLAYIKNLEKKENECIFPLFVIISFFLCAFLSGNYQYLLYVFAGSLLILCYLSKKMKTALILSLLLTSYYKITIGNSYLFQTLEYIFFFLTYLLLRNRSNSKKKMALPYLIIKFIFDFLMMCNSINFTFSLYKICFIITIFTILIIFNGAIIYFFFQFKKITNINITFKELEKEKRLRASIFKLTHELKNPLAVCNGYLDMIEMAKTESNKERYQNIIKEEIKRSLLIINDFSSLGKIKKLEKEELDLAVLFEDINFILFPLFKEKNSSIIMPQEDEFYLNGDYNRLKQVFLNILKNALEAKEKKRLQVSIKVKRMNGFYKILVIDNGKGMTKEELTHIYDIFYTTKKTGSGMGIPYIKEVINLHGGTINYKSQVSKGTTVTIMLPI